MSFENLHPRQKLIIIAFVFLISWVLGTFLIHHFERAQSWSYFDAFYFNVITTATIGFGDLTPQSREGKMITMVYAIFYVPLFVYSMSLIFESNVRKLYQREREIAHTIQDTERNVQSILDNKVM